MFAAIKLKYCDGHDPVHFGLPGVVFHFSPEMSTPPPGRALGPGSTFSSPAAAFKTSADLHSLPDCQLTVVVNWPPY